MSPSQNFFEKLAFDPELRKGWVARYFGGIRSLILIVVTLTLSGTATFFALEHELNPDILPLQEGEQERYRAYLKELRTGKGTGILRRKK